MLRSNINVPGSRNFSLESLEFGRRPYNIEFYMIYIQKKLIEKIYKFDFIRPVYFSHIFNYSFFQ